MQCPNCQSSTTQEYQKRISLGYRIFRCQSCKGMFNERSGTAFNDLQFPNRYRDDGVLWRIRYKLSWRDVVEMFVVRGFIFNHETLCHWEARFAPLLTALSEQRDLPSATAFFKQAVTYRRSQARPNHNGQACLLSTIHSAHTGS